MKPIPLKIDDIKNFLKKDGFTEDTLKNPNNKLYIETLENLKRDMINLMSQSPENFSTVNDVMTEIGKKLINIQRLRILIQPNIKMVVQKALSMDKVARKYLFARGYWVHDNGTYKRSVAKIFGRMDDKSFIMPTKKEVENIMRTVYVKRYKNGLK